MSHLTTSFADYKDIQNRKIYLDTSDGVPIQDIWLDTRDAHNQNIDITGYPTEKNPDVLERIIAASSNEGDLILDCFSGSGTTLSVASQLHRRWIGIDNSVEAITTTLKRFEIGLEPMGDFVTKAEVLHREEEHIQKTFQWEHDEETSSIEKTSHIPRKWDIVRNFVLSTTEDSAESLLSLLPQ